MALNNDRVRECFWLFGLVLPIGKDYQEKINQAFGHDIAKLIPDLCNTIGSLCMKDPDAFDGYLTFIQEAIEYMRENRNTLPAVDLPYEEYQEFMQKQLKKLKDKDVC